MSPIAFKKTIIGLLPLIGLYFILIISFGHNELIADEGRHVEYALNLTNGYYTDLENPSFRNGPGYPLLIAPLLALGISNVFITLINALLLFGAVLFFYKTIVNYVGHKKALAFSYLLGLYPPFFKWLVYLHSEALAVFLVCGFLFHFMALHKNYSKKHLLISASFLGLLVLTKVIFAYVIIALFIFYFFVFMFKKSRKVKSSLVVLSIGFLFCVPYLGYTYAVTGEKFMLGTQGGEILYWRSTPFENEYGDWISSDVVAGNDTAEYYTTADITKNHGSFFEEIQALPHVERDARFKEKAIQNMKEHPLKYLKNTGASALRLFFNSPYSYTIQKPSTFFYFLPNLFFVIFLFSATYLGITKRASVSFELRFIALMALIFIGGLILLDGRVRHLIPAIPLILAVFVIIHDKFLAISLKPSTH
jgi:4-amino-4-deoxy-L-arabinose transferase-like glycosyltransferase